MRDVHDRSPEYLQYGSGDNVAGHIVSHWKCHASREAEFERSDTGEPCGAADHCGKYQAIAVSLDRLQQPVGAALRKAAILILDIWTRSYLISQHYETENITCATRGRACRISQLPVYANLQGHRSGQACGRNRNGNR